ncbi:hypothetical protein F2980_02250 (plasmid) [Klebsiella quasipneumoniae subsp. quasipneumoniae]|nr:hypothetical protein F2980_02250 [Klebsiella quasipneumoniae subsp. quasipneumoniae]
MDSEEPPNVRVACSGDIDEVVRLMHDAAAWMSAKGTPAWDVARRHCCKVSDEAAFCLIQRPYISKTLLTRRISPRGSP